MKKKFLALPCIAAVAIATFVGTKTWESNAYERNGLLVQNVEALAGSENSTLWLRNDSDCVYICEGKAGTSVNLQFTGVNVIKLTIGVDGKASYTAKDAKTSCAAGGKEQCVARYCPVAFWSSNS